MKHFSHKDRLFTENRLVFLIGDTDDTTEDPAKAPSKIPSWKDKDNAEKRARRKKRLEDLKAAVDSSTFTADIKELAKGALASGDEAEIELVEKLLQNMASFNSIDFRNALKEVREKKKRNKENPSVYVQSNVNDILLGKLSKQEPETEKYKEKFHETVQKLVVLNGEEKKVRGEIDKKLERHLKSGEISTRSVEKIKNLDPRSNIVREKLIEILGPRLAANRELLNFLIDQKEKQARIIEEFLKYWKVTEVMLQENLKPIEIEKRKHNRINFMRRLTGINIKEGIALDYIGTGPDDKPISKKATIEKVDFVTYEPEFLRPDDIDEEYAKIIANEKADPPNTLRITVKFTSYDGTVVEKTLDEKHFQMWINQNQATEVINTKSELENIIGFKDFDQNLEEGMSIDFIAGKTQDVNPLIKTVGVRSIDQTNKTITLDDEVPVQLHTEAHELESVPQQRFKKTLTYGEFAKWFTRTRAEESMSLEKCKMLLTKQPDVLKSKYSNVNKNFWDFNDQPIQVVEGESLMVGGSQKIKITHVEDHEISLSSGLRFTPGQFLRFVKEHDVEKEKPQEDEDGEKGKVDGKDEKSKEADKSKDPNKTEDTVSKADQIGMLYGIYNGTRFLSLRDMFTLYTTTAEFVKRRLERNIKKRSGAFGQTLPGRWGAEFRNIAETAEQEEVSKYKQEMKDLDISVITGRLQATSDADEAKAAIQLLTEKGLLRFEDKKVWHTLNRIMKKNLSTSNYRKYYITDEGTNLNGEKGSDALKTAMDQVWGAPGGHDWYAANDSKYKSGVESFMQDANDYENKYKGHGVAAELHNMLLRHIKGDYVNPQRFEAFIRFIIKAGKAEIEDKVYYLVAGITEENPNGNPILSKQRHAAIEGEFLNRLPLLDYFTRFRPGGVTFPIEYARNLMADWKVNNSFNTDGSDKRYNKSAVQKFVWENMMTHREVLRRLNKGHRRSEEMDHDDAHLLIPMADEELILQSIVSNARGDQSNFTQEGLANGITGYTHYMKSIANNAEQPKEIREQMKKDGFMDPAELMQKTIKSFVAYESVVNKRNLYEKNYLRIGPSHLNNPPIVDDKKTTMEHLLEMRNLVWMVLREYNVPEDQIREYLEKSYWDGTVQQKKSHEEFLKGFGRKFDALVAEQGADKMIKAVIKAKNQGKLEGYRGKDMSGNKDELERRKSKG